MRTLLLFLVLAGVTRAQTPPPPPPGGTAPVGSTVAAVQKRLAGLLAADERLGKLPIGTDASDGPLGTTVVRAFAEGAYPGSGVVAVLLDAPTGTTYGRRGEKDLADLLRERRAFERPPAARELVRLVDVALYDAVLIVLDEHPATVEATPAGLVLRFARGWMPSGGGEWLVVTLPRAGKASVATSPLE